MDCLHSISVADITFPHRERPASYGASNYAPPEVADLVWPRIRTAGLCFVYTLHWIFTPFDLYSAEGKLLSLIKKRNLITSEGGNCWIQKMKEILKETQTLQSIAQLAVEYCDRGKQKTVCCPAGQHLIIKQVFLRKSRESNKANWINVHFSWLYRRRKITHWKILSRDMRVRFELFYFLLLSISLNILFFIREGKVRRYWMGKRSLLSVCLCDIPMRLFCYMRDNPQMWKKYKWENKYLFINNFLH